MLKIYLVSGKGGVGKSTVAAALGQSFASQGLKTLLIELGNNSYFNYVYGHKFSFKPYSLSPNLDLAIWSGEECLKEFITYYIKIHAVVDLFFENKVMKTLVKAAPALQELAILGKLTSGPRKIGPEMKYDRIILDAFSSGHFLSLMRVPRGMSEAISLGPMGQQSEGIHKVLTDNQLCKYIWVSTCEELPVTESLEFIELLNKEFKVEPHIVLNKTISQELPEALENSSGSFASYLKNIQRKEDWTKQKMAEQNKKFIEAPFCFEGSIQDRIEHLAKVFKTYEQFV